jgi:hypothetical protein
MSMKRNGVLCGVLAVLMFLAVAVAWSLPAGAQPAPPAAPPPAGVVLPVDQAVPPPPAPGDQPNRVTIDDLMAKLESIKAQKAALEKAEKEVVARLKQKMKEQQQRLKKLGVSAEESDTPQAASCVPCR